MTAIVSFCIGLVLGAVGFAILMRKRRKILDALERELNTPKKENV